MSELDYDRQIIDAIRDVMEEPQLSAEEQIERRMDAVLRELDEFMALAANAETVDLIDRNKILMGQIISRSQLIGSFLLALNTTNLRLVKHG
jgi:hypothetical protein